MELRTSLLVAISIPLVFTVSADASAGRTFVATTGNDANVITNCGVASPCRTFGAALGVTNSGGELVVLNSGGYGPATIGQSVTITATGVDASISVTTSGGAGLTINTTGNVTLRGLSLHGQATGANGIDVTQVGYLRLYDMLIENFTSHGVSMINGGNLEVYGSDMNDDVSAGLYLAGLTSPLAAYVAGSSFSHDGSGMAAGENSKVTLVDSSALFNSNGGFVTAEGQVTLINCRSAFNGNGMSSQNEGIMYFVNCVITNNVNAYTIFTGGTIAGTNPGTSFIDPSQGTTGTLSTAVVLK